MPSGPWWNLKQKNNIVSTGGTDRPLLSQQQVAELSSQLVIARAHTAEAKARLIESIRFSGQMRLMRRSMRPSPIL